MSPEEIVKELVRERIAINKRHREIRDEMVALLVDQKMTDFFSVDWKRLERVFITFKRG